MKGALAPFRNDPLKEEDPIEFSLSLLKGHVEKGGLCQKTEATVAKCLRPS